MLKVLKGVSHRLYIRYGFDLLFWLHHQLLDSCDPFPKMLSHLQWTNHTIASGTLH